MRYLSGYIWFAVVLCCVGCSSSMSPHWTGYYAANGRLLAGPVARVPAEAADALVRAFQGYVHAEEYEQAYAFLSRNIQDNHLTLIEFITEVAYLDDTFGPEQSLTMLRSQHKGRKVPVLKEAVYDPFVKYDMVVVRYTSRRDRKVTLMFGVTEEDGGLKIAVFGYRSRADDIEVVYGPAVYH